MAESCHFFPAENAGIMPEIAAFAVFHLTFFLYFLFYFHLTLVIRYVRSVRCLFYFIGAASCYPCPEGYMCTRQITADPCRQGYYCPEGTGYDIQACPVGTYGAREGLKLESECSNCTGALGVFHLFIYTGYILGGF